MISSRYEILRALTVKMRADFYSRVVQVGQELVAACQAHDPPGFLPRGQARIIIEPLLIACDELFIAFVAGVRESCGDLVAQHAQAEADNMRATIRALVDSSLTKYTDSGNATVH